MVTRTCPALAHNLSMSDPFDDESPSPSVAPQEELQEEPSPQSEPSDQELNDQADLEEDLFGGEDDDGSVNENVEDEDEELGKRRALEYDEDADPQPAPTRNLHIAEAPLPNLPFPKPSDGRHWDLRIPNFLNLNPLPFSDEEFLNEANESLDKEGDETDGSRPFSDQNVIRWRWKVDSNGQPVKQSNACVICWDDGSQSLQVGSELFDMVSTIDTRHPISSENLKETSAPNQGLTYLFAQHSELKLLEAQASITGQITLRPYSLNSLTHRTIVANRSFMKAHSQRQTQSRVITLDPEKEKNDKELEEERKLKELKKQESKLARQNSRQAYLSEGGSGSRGAGSGGVRSRRFNAPLLSDEGELGDDQIEEEEDYEEEMDEDDQENSDDHMEGGKTTRQEPELTELELADQRLEEQQFDQKRKSDRDYRQRFSKPAASPPEPPKITKRKLIIASDDEDWTSTNLPQLYMSPHPLSRL